MNKIALALPIGAERITALGFCHVSPAQPHPGLLRVGRGGVRVRTRHLTLG
jgi:hypothetical protein